MTLASTRQTILRLGILISLLLLVALLAILSDRFLTGSNIVNVVRQSSITGIIAVGMTFVILTAGIDLSVGAVLTLTSVVAASLMQQGLHPVLAVAAALGLGAVIGLFNGVLITTLHIPAFITTLGTWTLVRGLALAYTQGRPITGLPESFLWLGRGSLGPIPMPIVIAALTFALGYVFLAHTRAGEYIYAIGTNKEAARLAGIPVNRYETLVYVLAAFLAALAGLVLTARLNSAAPTPAEPYELNAIAAVVLGGTSFAGGIGGLGGTLLGTLMFGVINNGLNLLNISPLWEQVVKGVVIAAALLINRPRQ